MNKMDELVKQGKAVAARLTEPCNADGLPSPASWKRAAPLRFSADWLGKNADPARETEVRLLWTAEILFLRFRARYRTITVFADAQANGRRDQLWDRDVAEAFLQPEPSPERYYKELEVAPNGMWIDLDISPSGLADLKSGLARSVHIDEGQRIWVAELAIPLESLTQNFDPQQHWRANFYRVEGRSEPRQYLAWQPTFTPKPNFHVPEAFGTLSFI